MTMQDLRLDGRAGRLNAVLTAVVVDGPHGKEVPPSDGGGRCRRRAWSRRTSTRSTRTFRSVHPTSRRRKRGVGASRAGLLGRRLRLRRVAHPLHEPPASGPRRVHPGDTPPGRDDGRLAGSVARGGGRDADADDQPPRRSWELAGDLDQQSGTDPQYVRPLRTADDVGLRGGVSPGGYDRRLRPGGRVDGGSVRTPCSPPRPTPPSAGRAASVRSRGAGRRGRGRRLRPHLHRPALLRRQRPAARAGWDTAGAHGDAQERLAAAPRLLGRRHPRPRLRVGGDRTGAGGVLEVSGREAGRTTPTRGCPCRSSSGQCGGSSSTSSSAAC